MGPIQIQCRALSSPPQRWGAGCSLLAPGVSLLAAAPSPRDLKSALLLLAGAPGKEAPQRCHPGGKEAHPHPGSFHWPSGTCRGYQQLQANADSP